MDKMCVINWDHSYVLQPLIVVLWKSEQNFPQQVLGSTRRNNFKT